MSSADSPPRMRQHTLRAPCTLTGVGLHSGQRTVMTVRPAAAGHGVVFVRTDVPGRPCIPATIEHVVEQALRRTTVARDGVEVHTIEHLMSAFWGLGVDNALVEMDGTEVPGMDGSAAPFVDAMQTVGLEPQAADRRVLAVSEPVWVDEGDASIAVFPDREFRISYTLSYDHPLLRAQHVFTGTDAQQFRLEVASARTFCLESEARDLRTMGFGKGATYDNTLVIGDRGVIENALRFDDECARHKVLDLLGDLYLLGHRITGHVVAVRTGHAMNIRLLRSLRAHLAAPGSGTVRATRPHKEARGVLDVTALRGVLPHRYPFLLVDRIIELEPGRRGVGVKNVTINEEFFQGHFPGRPVMPGVLLLEALAQVCGVVFLSGERAGKYAYFMSVGNAKFRRPVVPGDQLRLEVEAIKLRSKTCQMAGRALVEGRVVAEAELGFALVDE